ncbi:Fe-S assembly protein IscX [Shewanella sp. Choline-02u-19]|jgi:FeS assembly protein IscX|uniref:Fe-S cluster assembly protein IscX n=1 Tax=unclassified Shewanella TaxID=196818 RepID=UPI000C31FE58|nr:MULTISPECIES: Fe-S cluster assembly protein IscX [unclassified Shewanella]PKG57518.1 Fe-S assembly protein IscX [Shewanella sp. GutDb-MelDb]PKG73389.1 Fe-S assembly protein IscX [Shewanella sp. GutCb]PKH63170.1 Fe-S assembly protein IscX [Shewanella sp. Bg11-22]PKI26999.1 Fe-S assembly protein IscX [Shewanella sp. Choline-02u-19]
MVLKWIDSQEIALALLENYPDVNPESIRFTELCDWVIKLETFEDDPDHCNERILEAIQAHWIDEK